MKRRLFVVISIARSGTTHLIHLLDAHPQVCARGEILNTHYTRDSEFMTDEELISTFRAAQDAAAECSAVGYKILQEQLAGRPFTLPALLQALPDLHIIVCERRNQLARIRSMVQAEKTWVWHAYDPPAERPAVRLRPDHALHQLRTAMAFHVQLRTITSHPMAWITYEDLCDDQDQVINQLWEFLGVPSIGHVESGEYRLEHRPLAQTITNLDELASCFSGTPYLQAARDVG